MRTVSVLQCLLALAVLGLLQGTTAGETMSACFSHANKTLDLECGAGNMVHIRRSFYGYSASGQCALTGAEEPQGCTVPEHVHYDCVGQRACSINLPTGRFGINVPACGQRSNYFQVEYACVPASSVSDICQSSHLTAQSGYIRTPRYPANYHQQGECSITVLVQPSQKLRLHIIDMDLKANSRMDCADLLYFNDKLRSITLCGKRHNNSYDMHSNYLHIELQSTSRGGSKGFWLYYEAWPPLPTSMLPPPVDQQPPQDEPQQQPQEPGEDHPNSNQPWPNDQGRGGSGGGGGGGEGEVGVTQEPDKGDHSTLLSTLQPSPRPGSTVPLYRNSNTSSKQLPFAAIAGGVIGTLSLILIVLLLLLFIKWYKERRYNKVEKVLEIRNPAFRNSSDFHEAQQQHHNHHNHHHHQQQQHPSCAPGYTPHRLSSNSGYYC